MRESLSNKTVQLYLDKYKYVCDPSRSLENRFKTVYITCMFQRMWFIQRKQIHSYVCFKKITQKQSKAREIIKLVNKTP